MTQGRKRRKHVEEAVVPSPAARTRRNSAPHTPSALIANITCTRSRHNLATCPRARPTCRERTTTKPFYSVSEMLAGPIAPPARTSLKRSQEAPAARDDVAPRPGLARKQTYRRVHVAPICRSPSIPATDNTRIRCSTARGVRDTGFNSPAASVRRCESSAASNIASNSAARGPTTPAGRLAQVSMPAPRPSDHDTLTSSGSPIV